MRELRLVLLEDNPLDAELVLASLAEDGLRCQATQTRTAAEFAAALSRPGLDLILADYHLPDFDGMSALQQARELCLHVPFIFVSGALGEERAIEALRGGATDYVPKHRLERLAPVVRRALAEAEERRRRREAEEALQRQAQQLLLADRRKDEFLAMLSHELRTPLSAIVQALELLRLHHGDESDPAWEVARDGAEGLRLLLADRPEVALVDLGLPGLTGYEVARRTRDAEREAGLPRLRLIALTGYGQAEDRRKIAEAGFSAHLIKPPDLDELLRLLSE